MVLTAVVAAVMTLAACSPGAGQEAPTAVTRHAAAAVPAGTVMNQRLPQQVATTELVDQNGNTTSLASLHGQIVVLAPLLTLCQETCPMTSINMYRAAQQVQRLGMAGKVEFVELTVDPNRDTVRRVHAYQNLYGNLPNWSLLTGRPERVKALWKALGVSTDKVPSDEPVRDWMTGRLLKHPYDIHHQDVVFVIDPAGHIRWLTVGHPDARGTTLPSTLTKFLNTEGRADYRHPRAHGAGSWTAHDIEQAVRYVAALSNAA